MLTAREAKILELLAVNKTRWCAAKPLSRFGEWKTKTILLPEVWMYSSRKIRTALEDEPGVELKTIRGVGFKLIAE